MSVFNTISKSGKLLACIWLVRVSWCGGMWAHWVYHGGSVPCRWWSDKWRSVPCRQWAHDHDDSGCTIQVVVRCIMMVLDLPSCFTMAMQCVWQWQCTHHSNVCVNDIKNNTPTTHMLNPPPTWIIVDPISTFTPYQPVHVHWVYHTCRAVSVPCRCRCR